MEYTKPFKLISSMICFILVIVSVADVYVAGDLKEQKRENISESINVQCRSWSKINISNLDCIFKEDFETSVFPPINWSVSIKNTNYSWYNDSVTKYAGNCSASCIHDPDNNLQDEWLISPEINITGYTEIYLYFNWFTSYFWSVSPYDNYDFNVYILTNEMENRTIIWNEADVGSFENWIWYNTTKDGGSIDISSYREDYIIRIGFQYIGINGAKLNIDDIGLYGCHNTNPPIVNANGPYYGYVGDEIPFYGNVTGGEPGYKWNWDFGDGGQSNQRNPTHIYQNVGNYSVSLEVSDGTKASNSDETTAYIMNMSKVPELVIKNITGPLGIHATIANQGCVDANDVCWQIHFTGGPTNHIQECTMGSIPCIHRCCCCEIRSELFMGFGLVHINLFVDAMNMQRINKVCTAIMFGNYVFPISD